MIDNLGIYYDEKYNLPVHLDGGGDSAARLGTIHTLFELRRRLGIQNTGFINCTKEDYIRQRHWLFPVPFERGIFRRYPDGIYGDIDSWASPGRDQETPLVIADGFYGLETSVKDLVRQHEKRPLFAYQNFKIETIGKHTEQEMLDRGFSTKGLGVWFRGDICGPEHRNVYRRALKEDPSWLGDKHLALSSRVRINNEDPDNVGDDLNHTLMLLQAHFMHRTDNSKRALELYFKKRPVNLGCYLETIYEKYPYVRGDEKMVTHNCREYFKAGREPDCDPVVGAWRWYFRAEAKAPPGIARLAEPVLDHISRNL